MLVFFMIGPTQKKKWFNFGKDLNLILDTKLSQIFNGLIIPCMTGFLVNVTPTVISGPSCTVTVA